MEQRKKKKIEREKNSFFGGTRVLKPCFPRKFLCVILSFFVSCETERKRKREREGGGGRERERRERERERERRERERERRERERERRERERRERERARRIAVYERGWGIIHVL